MAQASLSTCRSHLLPVAVSLREKGPSFRSSCLVVTFARESLHRSRNIDPPALRAGIKLRPQQKTLVCDPLILSFSLREKGPSFRSSCLVVTFARESLHRSRNIGPPALRAGIKLRPQQKTLVCDPLILSFGSGILLRSNGYIPVAVSLREKGPSFRSSCLVVTFARESLHRSRNIGPPALRAGDRGRGSEPQSWLLRCTGSWIHAARVPG